MSHLLKIYKSLLREGAPLNEATPEYTKRKKEPTANVVKNNNFYNLLIRKMRTPLEDFEVLPYILEEKPSGKEKYTPQGGRLTGTKFANFIELPKIEPTPQPANEFVNWDEQIIQKGEQAIARLASSLANHTYQLQQQGTLLGDVLEGGNALEFYTPPLEASQTFSILRTNPDGSTTTLKLPIIFVGYLNFDENNKAMLVSPEVLPTGDQISIGFWAYLHEPVSGEQSLIEARDEKGRIILNIQLRSNSGKTYFYCGEKNNKQHRIYKNLDINQYLNKWTYWTFVRDVNKKVMGIYNNGQLLHKSKATGKFQPLRAAYTVMLGAQVDGNNPFLGRLAEFNIWDIAQNEAAINALISKKGQEMGGLVASLSPDEKGVLMLLPSS